MNGKEDVLDERINKLGLKMQKTREFGNKKRR